MIGYTEFQIHILTKHLQPQKPSPSYTEIKSHPLILSKMVNTKTILLLLPLLTLSFAAPTPTPHNNIQERNLQKTNLQARAPATQTPEAAKRQEKTKRTPIPTKKPAITEAQFKALRELDRKKAAAAKKEADRLNN